MRKRAIIYLLFALAFTALAFFTSTRSGAEHNELGGRIVNWLNDTFFSGSLSSEEKTSISSVAAKLFGHYGLYSLIGLFLSLFLREGRIPGMWAFVVWLSYGLVISMMGEFIQLFSNGRYPSFNDVVIDFSGYAAPNLLHGLYSSKHRDNYSITLRDNI